jgi:YVTN family beta-propeller protein
MQTFKIFLVPACCLILAVLVLAGGAPARVAKAGDASDKPAVSGKNAATSEKKSDKQEAAATDTNRITREGLNIEFLAGPAGSGADGVSKLMEGHTAEIAFRVTDAETGEPVRGLYPVAYMDLAAGEEAEQSQSQGFFKPGGCKDRVGLYLQGLVGIRPLIDLNSYFVMVMNQDTTISVIDPILGIQGRTNLYAQVILKRNPADWVKTADEKRLFVSMPAADMVAVVDITQFKLTHNLPAGDSPTRVVLQTDEKYLWIGNNTRKPGQSGVTVIDTTTLQQVAQIPTGSGHHEIALSSDDRYAFVTNRDDGTVTVIDVQNLKKVKDLKLGPRPIALAYSDLSRALYVSDGETGEIAVVDDDLKVVTRIRTAPGLGPMQVSQDGRWTIAVNPSTNAVYVIDTASNQRIHTLPIEGRPFRVAFSGAFAYVRSLDNEYVSMINLSQLDRGGPPPVTRFQAGRMAPGKVADMSIADTMVPAPGEASMLVVSPADTTVYYYMEGMNAPMGNFRNYGHRPRAVAVVDRTLKEREAGVYSAKVRIPAAGDYDVAFLLDTPVMLHCFSVTAGENPVLAQQKRLPLAVEYLVKERRLKVGDTVPLRFRLTNPETRKPESDLKDVTVLYYPASGVGGRRIVRAAALGDGVYEATLSLPYPGGYYVYVGSASKQMPHAKLPYLSLLAMRQPPPHDATAGKKQGVTP